jgi:molecular chaperone GrpE (heat shock protein)
MTMNSPRELEVSDGFKTVMQQLSAEAKKSTASHPPARPDAEPAAERVSIEDRLQNLEQALSKKIDDLARAVAQNKSEDQNDHFRNIEEQLGALRNSESVNQRLFDSLHDELLKYRDNFVHESLQKPFIHDLVHLFDDLTSLAGQLGTGAQEQKKRGQIAQWCENLENTIHSVMEILHRLEVKEIEPKERIDRELHRVVSYEPADYPEDDGVIVMRIKRGFFWRGKLIRPEEVIAKRYG